MDSLNQKALRALFILLISTQTPSLFAQAPSPRTSFFRKLHPDSFVNAKLKWLPLPSIQVAPELGVGFGAALDFFFSTRAEDDSTDLTRESYIWLQGLYSIRKQAILDVQWQVYTARERYITRGRAGFVDFNEYFWGVGNTVTDLADPTLAFYQRLHAQGRVLKRLGSQYFAGLSFNYSQTTKISFDISPEKANLVKDLKGINSSLVSGAGLAFLADFRDNPYSPTRGCYAELSHIWHGEWLGSRFTYRDMQIDMRKYFELSAKDFLGVQVFANFTDGILPWRELSRLGSPFLMRGFSAGRYRDAQYIASQIEYRRQLNRFFVAAVFVGSGQVAAKTSDISNENWRLAGGGGLRFLINKKKNVYIRFDYARSTEGDAGFYFRLADAF